MGDQAGSEPTPRRNQGAPGAPVGRRLRAETKDALLRATTGLLGAPEVALTAERPDGVLASPVELPGRRLWLWASAEGRTEPFGDEEREMLGTLAALGSTALSNAELYSEAKQRRDELAVLLGGIGEGVCTVDAAGRIVLMSPAGARLLGWPDDDVGDGTVPAGTTTPRFLLDPARRAMALRQNVVSEDIRFERTDGSHFRASLTASPVGDDGDPTAAVIVFRDTSERRAFEDQLARHAFQDPLTRLANRRLLEDHLDHALLQAQRSGTQVAVLFGDLDCFKAVNDSLGHQVGDELLRAVADRLRQAVRPGDTLSRFGGDEFVVVLEGITSPEDANQVAQRIRQDLSEPVVLSGGHEVVATMSIGMALSRSCGSTTEDLIHEADVAMYRAKQRGRDGVIAVFDDGDAEPAAAGDTELPPDLETALLHAVERGEVVVHFQPVISLGDQRIVGAEALVRWNHPEAGLLTPPQFIELAEGNGAILPIGRFVLEQACRLAKTWQETLGVTLSVGVNLSSRQFQQPGLEVEVAEVLASTGVDPSQVCLEITESLAMYDVEQTATILSTLHGLGVHLAIDDFGTGHSSLGYLAQFPIDVIKIDQSFTRDIDHDPVKAAIVSAVIALSDAIDATTVVEGVETLAELEQVTSLGCDMAQGFYFSRPLLPEAFEAMVSEAGLGETPDMRIFRWEALTG